MRPNRPRHRRGAGTHIYEVRPLALTREESGVTDDGPDTRRWRSSTLARVGAALCAAPIIAIGIGLLSGFTNGGAVGERLLGVILIVSASLGVWALAFRPSIRLDNENVTVVNPVRTRRIPIDQIADASTARYTGVTVRFFDGRSIQSVTAWAVQKSNLMTWTNRTTRADSVTAAIDAAVARRRQFRTPS